MKTAFEYTKKKKQIRTLNCNIIDVPMYKCQVKLLFGDKAKQLEKDWNKDVSGCGAITRNYLDEGSVLVSFFHAKPSLDDVVHEFHHATDMIMDSIKHKRDTKSDEPSAYLIGYLIREYLKIK